MPATAQQASTWALVAAGVALICVLGWSLLHTPTVPRPGDPRYRAEVALDALLGEGRRRPGPDADTVERAQARIATREELERELASCGPAGLEAIQLRWERTDTVGRERLVVALGNMPGHASKKLLGTLPREGLSPVARRDVAKYITWDPTPDSTSITALESLLEDPSPMVRQQALESLVRLLPVDRARIAAIVAKLKDTDTDPAVRARAEALADALGR
jgi:hypothetical protein